MYANNLRVPTEQDVQNAVEEVLKEILPSAPALLPTKSVVTVTKTGKPRKPRQGKSTPNLFLSEFRRIHNYHNMPSQVEDIFMGAVRQTTSANSLHNPYVVFNLLKTLNTISTESVYFAVNSRRPKAEHISTRYAQELAAVCRNVISAFEHHSEVKNITRHIRDESLYDDFDIESDAEGYRNHVQTVQTTEQKRQLLAQAGLTPEQVESHVNGEKVQWGASIRCGSGSSSGVQSSYVHADIYPESIDNLLWLPDLCCYVDVTTGEMFDW